MTVADLKLGQPDPLGGTITEIYGFKPPEYAVYATDLRLSVRFADDPTTETEQRRGMAPLNPLRGEINGLIDGWRRRDRGRTGLREKAQRYDRRVADALVVAFEHDVDDAEAILLQVKQDIVDDRTSWARLEYLVAALGTSFLVMALVWLVAAAESVTNATRAPSAPILPSDLWRAAASGALGAFFSIALSIRSRTVLPDLRRTSNITDASLRIGIGFIAASVLMALVGARAVSLGVGDAKFDSATTPIWLFTMIVGFLAGFSERLVPDLLAKAVASPQSPPPASEPSRRMPAAAAGRAASAGARAKDDAGDGAAPVVGMRAAADVDPAPQEAALDHCACDIELRPEEATADAELPAASGGVQAGDGEQPK